MVWPVSSFSCIAIVPPTYESGLPCATEAPAKLRVRTVSKRLFVFIDPRTAADVCLRQSASDRGHTSGVSVLGSDQKRAEQREPRRRMRGRFCVRNKMRLVRERKQDRNRIRDVNRSERLL